MEQYQELNKYSDIMDLKDVSEFFKISKDTARKLCLNNELEHIRIGRLYKIPKECLVKFLQKTK